MTIYLITLALAFLIVGVAHVSLLHERKALMHGYNAVSRTLVVRGPAYVQFKGQQFWSKDNIVLKINVETDQTEAGPVGVVAESKVETSITVSCNLIGEFEALAVLYPYVTATVGDSVFGATDDLLQIIGVDGTDIQLKNAAVTKMPPIKLSATETMFGDVEFTCLREDGEEWSHEDSLYEVAGGAVPDFGTIDPSLIYKQCVSAAWGAVAPWDAFEAADGWEIDFDLQLDPLSLDCQGIVDMTFGKLEVNAKAKPVGPTDSDILETALAIQGGGVNRGDALTGDHLDLTGQNGSMFIRLSAAGMTEAGQEFGSNTLRNSVCNWRSTRVFQSDGTLYPLFYIGAVAATDPI